MIERKHSQAPSDSDSQTPAQQAPSTQYQSPAFLPIAPPSLKPEISKEELEELLDNYVSKEELAHTTASIQHLQTNVIQNHSSISTITQAFESHQSSITSQISTLSHSESQLKDIQSKLAGLLPLEKQIQQSNAKLDSLESEVHKLKETIRRSEQNIKQKATGEDLEALREYVVSALSQRPQAITRQGSNIQDSNIELLQRINTIEMIKADSLEVKQLRSQLQHLADEVEERLKAPASRQRTQTGENSEISSIQGKIATVIQKVNQLEVIVEDLTEKVEQSEQAENLIELSAQFKSFTSTINAKILQIFNRLSDAPQSASFEPELLKQIEAKLMEQLQETLKSLQSKFADKLATRKSLKHLETLIHDCLKRLSEQKIESKNAILVKRPLGGWSCASCQNDIESQIAKARYSPWNRMPQRDPSESIARIGNGFSRILSVHAESIANRQRVTGSPVQDDVGEVNLSETVILPPVQKAERYVSVRKSVQ